MAVTPIDAETVLAELASADRLLVQQILKPIANEYRISIPDPGSTSEGRPLLYVKQKKLKIKEDIRFRLSPDSEEYLFMIKSRSMFEFRGRHDVLDADDQSIGSLEKDFGKSLYRSRWVVRDATGAEVVAGQEERLSIALARRIAGLLPEWLAPLSWLPFNFTILREGKPVARYQRILGTFRDRYVLEVGSSSRASTDGCSWPSRSGSTRCKTASSTAQSRPRARSNGHEESSRPTTPPKAGDSGVVVQEIYERGHGEAGPLTDGRSSGRGYTRPPMSRRVLVIGLDCAAPQLVFDQWLDELQTSGASPSAAASACCGAATRRSRCPRGR